MIRPTMNIAVTGATGFVGRHVLVALAQHAVAVTSVTRQELAGRLSSSQVSVVQMDLADFSGVFDRMGRPDTLIHLAWGGYPTIDLCITSNGNCLYNITS